MKTLIFLPIEVKQREFYSKLFFSYRALQKNFNCFIGDKIAINRAIKYLGNGIYFYKSMNFYDTSHIKSVKNKGNIYVVQDEEGAVLTKKEFQKFTKVRGSNKNLSEIDRFYTWGKFDDNIWKKNYINFREKFFLTGSPRIDIWKKKIAEKIFLSEVNYLKKKYHNFTLIVSSGISSKKELKKKIHIDKITRSPLKENKNELEKRNFWQLKINRDLFEIAQQLAIQNPKKNFIYRPHPDENLNDYKYQTKKKSNFFIDNSLDVLPWLIASDTIIQSCSTVAIQAEILNKPIISFNPNYLKNNHRNFPNKFGINIKNKNDLFKIFKKNDLKYKSKKILSKRFYISKRYCSDYILKDMKKIINKKKFKVNLIKFYLLGFIFDIKDRLIKFNIFKKRNQTLYTPRRSFRTKNPGISKEEITNFYKKINDKNDIRVMKFLNNGFLISNVIKKKLRFNKN
ncbi:hypothetical protein N9J34_01470 [Candidatus Pelagibacter ubique]|nr:hypothetical protein [Candidatus Pelagibacter ubique]